MKTYPIREVSTLFGFHASTLRYYEEVGLLPPVERTETGQRVYTQAHLDRLGAIACFKETGMSIAKLQTLFRYEENESEHITDILALLEEQRVSVWNQLQTLKKDYVQICRKLSYYQGIQTAMLNDVPAPNWDAYKDCTYEI